MNQAGLPFFERLIFALVVYFKILFDGTYAREVKEGANALPPAEAEKKALPAPPPGPPPSDAALQLLALLQREGRLVDFLEEDMASFADADIGAAARVVHAGCRKALREHVTLEPVRREAEGTKVTLQDGFAPDAIKLTGNVTGKAPYVGTLQHRGWRAVSVSLPTVIAGHDAKVIAQAEVEL